MCYIHLACCAAKQRRVHSCRRKRRSANSVAASLPRRSVAESLQPQRRSANSVAAWIQRRSANSVAASQRRSRVAPSQRQQRRSVAPAWQLRSANSVAASQRRSRVAASQRQQHLSVAPALLQRRSSVAASQRHWLNGSVAASQRRHPPPGASQRNVGNPRFGPLCPCTGLIDLHRWMVSMLLRGCGHITWFWTASKLAWRSRLRHSIWRIFWHSILHSFGILSDIRVQEPAEEETRMSTEGRRKEEQEGRRREGATPSLETRGPHLADGGEKMRVIWKPVFALGHSYSFGFGICTYPKICPNIALKK